MAETADLKSLARRIIERDRARDTGQDGPSRDCLASELASRQYFEAVSLSRSPKGRDTKTAIPEPFAITIAALEQRCPDYIDTTDWQKAIEDGRRFIGRWGEQTASLGWTARDLFGLPRIPEKPAPNYRRLSRYDETGLIWLLRGRPVVALSDDTAAIEQPTGAITIYRKNNKPPLGPVGDSLDDIDPSGWQPDQGR
jgi:hypothetical protein